MTFEQIADLTDHQLTQIVLRPQPGEKRGDSGMTWEEAANKARADVGLPPLVIE